MIKLNTQNITRATAFDGNVVFFDWQAILSEVSKKVLIFNSKKKYLDEEEAKDVVQDACMKIFLHLGEFDASKAKLSTWVSKIAVNCYYDALRERSKRQSLFRPYSRKLNNGDDDSEVLTGYPEYCVDAEVMAAELEGLLKLALEPLCDTYREAIRCIVQGVPPEEMIEHLHCSKKNLRPTISRARKEARKSCVALGLI